MRVRSPDGRDDGAAAGRGMMEGMDARRAGPDDLDLVADTLALAFSADPAWTWVFDDPARCTEQLRVGVGPAPPGLGAATAGSG